MWDKEREIERIRNIVIGVILIAAVLGLVFGYLSINRRIEEEDYMLQDIHSGQRQELNDARQENKDYVNRVYQEHQDVLAQYLPGIVCWGDSLTTGSSGNVSYPYTLQKYLDVYVSNIYDLRYSLTATEGLSVQDWDDYKISIPVVNMGAGRENSATVLARSGVRSFVVSKDFVIPAGQDTVSVSITTETGEIVNPLLAGDGGVNPVTIAGVQGTLTRNGSANSWTRNVYYFTRLEAGEEVSVTAGEYITIASADKYKDYIHVVWLGTYDTNVKPSKLVENVKALLQRQNINTDRYLVIGPCTYNGSWTASRFSDGLEAIDSTMMQAFGDRYINLRKYLLEDGLRDAKISATAQDKKSILNGLVPDSFRSNAKGADLNGVAYELLGKIVYERMERLGYLNEVREALKLDRIVQDILREEPKYFENQLNAY